MCFVLQKWELSLAPSLAVSANDARVAKWLRDVFPQPYTLADAEAFIRFAAGENARGDFYRAIVIGGRAAGSISLSRGTDVNERSAEIGYWLAPGDWGRGIMTQAVRAVCAKTFTETDIVRIFAVPFAANAASRRVLEKCGFALEGVMRKSVWKGGALSDACLYALVKEENGQ